MITNLGRKVTSLVLVSLAALAAFLWPGRTPIPLGLDLKGGSRLVYKVDLDKGIKEGLLDPAVKQDPQRFLDTQRTILQERIDGLGLRDIPILIQGQDELLIELPGMGPEEVQNIKNILTNLGALEFGIVADSTKGDSIDVAAERKKLDDWLKKNPGLNYKVFNLTAEKDGGPREGYRWYPDNSRQALAAAGDAGSQQFGLIRLEKNAKWNFRGSDLREANEGSDPMKGPIVIFDMKESRKADFEAFTRANVNRQMAIILNGEIRTDPVIKSPLPGGGIIEGNFSVADVQALTKVLKTGSLAVKPELQSETTVGASLGEDAIDRAKTATLITMILIPLFMIVYYGGAPFWFSSGVIASLGLLFNLALILGAMAFFRATLTLPGIGGLILTVGMAVDANILIYERIREEIERGRSLMQAVHEGFDKAAATIIDSNLTTLISGLILFWVGSGPIKGFAVTLCIGILTTLFSVLVLSKVLFHVGLAKGWIREIRYLKFLSKPSLKFMKFKGAAVFVSILFIALGLWEFAQANPNEKYGLDFTGGAIVRAQTKEPVSIDEVRSRVTKVYESASVTLNRSVRADLGRGMSDDFTIKFKLSENERKGQASGQVPSYIGDLRKALQGLLVADGISDPKIEKQEGSATAKTSFDLHLAGVSDEARIKAVLAKSQNLLEPKIAKSGDSGLEWSVTGLVPATTEPESLRADLVSCFIQAASSSDKDAPRLLNPFPEHNQLGARVVTNLRDQAVLALLLAFLGIILYVRFRFHEYRWGVGAVVAIVHDVAVALGAVVLVHSYGLVSAEIELTMLAAFLTIVGYSVNDTIVIFDRIRENSERMRMPMEELMDLSINQTLSRTILTATTVMITVTVMFFVNYGRGNVLEGFSFAMMVGTFVGCYSSIYIASPIVLYFIKREEKRSGGVKTIAKGTAIAQK